MKKLLIKGRKYSVAEVVAVCQAFDKNELAGLIETNPPKKPFVFDGASMFPDKIGNVDTDYATHWHDIRYWAGIKGDWLMRFLSDVEMVKDLIQVCKSTTELAQLMFNGVRVGGSEHTGAKWRWAYGR